jgi:hypothetical protein
MPRHHFFGAGEIIIFEKNHVRAGYFVWQKNIICLFVYVCEAGYVPINPDLVYRSIMNFAWVLCSGFGQRGNQSDWPIGIRQFSPI